MNRRVARISKHQIKWITNIEFQVNLHVYYKRDLLFILNRTRELCEKAKMAYLATASAPKRENNNRSVERTPDCTAESDHEQNNTAVGLCDGDVIEIMSETSEFSNGSDLDKYIDRCSFKSFGEISVKTDENDDVCIEIGDSEDGSEGFNECLSNASDGNASYSDEDSTEESTATAKPSFREVPQEPIRNFECFECKYSTVDVFDLKQHMKTHSEQDEQPPAADCNKCPICPESFQQMSELQEHLLRHSTVRRRKLHKKPRNEALLRENCAICEKAFKYKSVLL